MIHITVKDPEERNRVVTEALRRGHYPIVASLHCLVVADIGLAVEMFVRVAQSVAESRGEDPWKMTWTYGVNDKKEECVAVYANEPHNVVLYGVTDKEFSVVTGCGDFDHVN